MASYEVELRFRGSSTVTGEWTALKTADLRYREWVGLYGSLPGVRLAPSRAHRRRCERAEGLAAAEWRRRVGPLAERDTAVSLVLPAPSLAVACQDLTMFSLGRDGMRDLQVQAMDLGAELARGQWRPNRADRRALRQLADADGPVIHRDVITEVFTAHGPRQASKMTPRLATLLVHAAAAQDLPSIAALPEAQDALLAVTAFVRSAA